MSDEEDDDAPAPADDDADEAGQPDASLAGSALGRSAMGRSTALAGSTMDKSAMERSAMGRSVAAPPPPAEEKARVYDENDAATRIQAMHRGRKGRKEAKRRRKSAERRMALREEEMALEKARLEAELAGLDRPRTPCRYPKGPDQRGVDNPHLGPRERDPRTGRDHFPGSAWEQWTAMPDGSTQHNWALCRACRGSELCRGVAFDMESVRHAVERGFALRAFEKGLRESFPSYSRLRGEQGDWEPAESAYVPDWMDEEGSTAMHELAYETQDVEGAKDAMVLLLAKGWSMHVRHAKTGMTAADIAEEVGSRKLGRWLRAEAYLAPLEFLQRKMQEEAQMRLQRGSTQDDSFDMLTPLDSRPPTSN